MPELRDWGHDDGRLRIGAGVSYTRVIDELGDSLPGLALASRTVGSPQIRNRGTIGGNLGAASPAGDAHPPLLAAAAEVELASTRGVRRVPVRDFYVGPKRNVLADDELIAAVCVAPAARAAAVLEDRHAQRDGHRGVLVRALARPGRAGASAPGSDRRAPPRSSPPRRSGSWRRRSRRRGLGRAESALGEPALERFGELVASAARPIDDVRSTAAYRVHALGVLARRTLAWALGSEA